MTTCYISTRLKIYYRNLVQQNVSEEAANSAAPAELHVLRTLRAQTEIRNEENNMKEIMFYYAQCNKRINETMIDNIQKNIKDPFSLSLDGYFFKTLGQILEHIFVADMIWMKAFSDLNSYGMSLENEVMPIPSYDDHIFTNFSDYCKARVDLDTFICAYMEKIDDSLLQKTVSRKTKDGQLMERMASKAIIHFFNHQTHHRGQISNILDNLKIENNYSNMIFLDF